MKKVLGTMLAVGLMAASANAATLSIVWSGTGGSTTTSADVSSTISIDVVLELASAADTLNTVGFTHGAQPLLSHESVTGLDATLSDVTDQVGAGTLGSVGEQVGFASPDPNNSFLTGTGGPISFILGRYAVHLDPSATIGTTIEVVFGQPSTTALLGGAGQLAYAPLLMGGAGTYWYGTGSPTTTGNPLGNQTADPLMLTITPEPASLSLLVLGGLAALRRRR